MADVAKYIKIFNTSPDDTYVSKRVTAINAIETAIKKKTLTNDIIGFANQLIIALETPSNSSVVINDVAVAALKKSSTSFVADEEQLQMLTCTLLATLQFLEKAKGYKHIASPEFILAIALWSGLSFQKPIAKKERLEALRSELLTTAAKMVEDVSLTSRDRKKTVLRTPLTVPSPDTFGAFIPMVESTYGNLIDAMRTNAHLDREEIDILWWVIGGWSNTCRVQISNLNPVQTAMVAAFEIGGLLKRFPANAHTHLACRGVQHTDEFSGAEILQHMGDISSLIANDLNPKDVIKDHSKIFIVCNLIIDGTNASDLKHKRPISEWAARLLLELSLLNIKNFAE